MVIVASLLRIQRLQAAERIQEAVDHAACLPQGLGRPLFAKRHAGATPRILLVAFPLPPSSKSPSACALQVARAMRRLKGIFTKDSVKGVRGKYKCRSHCYIS